MAAVTESPLARLRRIRDMLGKMEGMVEKAVAERDRLICEAGGGCSQRQIGQAAGLSQSQVQRIYSQRQIGLAAGLSSGRVCQIIRRGAAKPSKRQAPEKEQTAPVDIALPPPVLPPPPPPIAGAMRTLTCVCGAGTSDGEGNCLQCSKPLAGVMA
jgi:hypothetical protein